MPKYQVKYIHNKCGGDIALNFFTGRKCKKCGKKWGILGFIFDPVSIRPVKIQLPYEAKKTSYAKWADKLPYVGQVAENLPNWPKWARILSLFIFLALLYLVIWLIVK